MLQGTKKEEEKASMTVLEFVSNQKFLQPLTEEPSMAIIAAKNSAKIAEPDSKLLAKQPRQAALEFLNILPHEDWSWLATDAPSVLHLIQVWIGGDKITSLIKGALGGCTLMLKCFKIVNSSIEQ